ncbi:MAG: AAA family ATPase [Solirubrobacteraceae bacterium]
MNPNCVWLRVAPKGHNTTASVATAKLMTATTLGDDMRPAGRLSGAELEGSSRAIDHTNGREIAGGVHATQATPAATGTPRRQQKQRAGRFGGAPSTEGPSPAHGNLALAASGLRRSHLGPNGSDVRALAKMTSLPQQSTLSDVMRPISGHRWLLLLFVVVALASSVAVSVNQARTYTATASLAFRDETQSLGLVGIAIAPTQTADQLASANAQTVLQQSVIARVKANIRSPLSVDALTHNVTATVQPNSNLVSIQAQAHTASAAEELANAVAREGTATANRDARGTFVAEEQALRSRKPSTKDPAALAIFNEQDGRLKALSAIASPAQVAALAVRPTSPTSPKPVRNAILGALLGLLLGLLAVFARDSFDRRIRSVGEAEAILELPLLGHIRKETMGLNPNPQGEHSVSNADWELFRILRRNLDFLEEGAPPKTVAVTSAIPEEGKTTVASFLAFTSAAAGKRTLLIECDLRRPVLAARLGLASEPGVTDYVAGTAEPGSILRTIPFGDAASDTKAGPDVDIESTQQFSHHLVCITAGSRTAHPVEVLRSERFRSMLTEIESAYDLVVLDTPPLLSVVDVLELLPLVESVVLCVRALSTSRAQALAGKAAIERLPRRPIGLVVTGTRRRDETEYGYYGYYG